LALTDQNKELSLSNKRVAEKLAAFRDQAVKNKLEVANNSSIILALKTWLKRLKKRIGQPELASCTLKHELLTSDSPRASSSRN
jgi:hypothetical protein